MKKSKDICEKFPSLKRLQKEPKPEQDKKTFVAQFPAGSASEKSETEREKILRQGRESFRAFCNAINPDFFRPDRGYQDTVCGVMQAMYRKELINPVTKIPYDILILNLPPGFGKSYTASLFSIWAFGQSIKNQVITVSYGQDLGIAFSKTVRNGIQEQEIRGDKTSFVPCSFFPKLKIRDGDGAADQWALEGNYMSYLGTSFTGKITGMRGNLLIIDDPIKNAEEAVNERVKESHWNFYKNTASSRLLPGALQMIIQTRWATDDLSGMLLQKFPERCYELRLAALDEEDQSLCESLYPTRDLLQKRAVLDTHIWAANYLQVPVDIKGALYSGFKTYDAVDYDAFERTIAYIDTADEGADYLCVIMGGVIGRYGYVTDIYYTDESMEITEPETARRLALHRIRDTLVESNNGGRGFARNIEAELKKLKCRKCNVTWFHQSKNKKTRILVNASNVMEQIILPEEWQRRFPAFSQAISGYQRKGKNAHDDAPDALTGFVEMVNGDVKGHKKPLGKPVFWRGMF